MFSEYNLIAASFKFPEKMSIGSFNIIEENVSIGEDNTRARALYSLFNRFFYGDINWYPQKRVSE